MKIERFNNELHPGITMHKIPVRAGFAGLVFTIGMMAVCLMGIPALIYFLLLAIVLGIGFAVMLRFMPRQAGFVAFVFSALVLACLVAIPGVDDWHREQEIDTKDVYASVVAPPRVSELAPQCDCRQGQSKQPCDRTTQHDRSQKRPQPPSPFDGTWEGKMNDLPGVNLTVANASGGGIGGVVVFTFKCGEMTAGGESPANS